MAQDFGKMVACNFARQSSSLFAGAATHIIFFLQDALLNNSPTSRIRLAYFTTNQHHVKKLAKNKRAVISRLSCVA